MNKSQRFSSVNDVDQDDYDGDYQKNMNKTTQRIGGHKTHKPQNNENDSDRVQHSKYPFFIFSLPQKAVSCFDLFNIKPR
jgi:hypothetical protein